jgi:hypothetical protein
MKLNVKDPQLLVELEKYMDESEYGKISLEEAQNRGAISVFRDFTVETQDLELMDDKYNFFGHCSIEIQNVFSSMYVGNKIMYHTPYKITPISATFGISFRVETFVVQATDEEWYGRG